MSTKTAPKKQPTTEKSTRKVTPIQTVQPEAPTVQNGAPADDILAQALSFKAQYETLMGQAKDNALTKIQTLLDSLKSMGFAYQLTPITAHPLTGKPGAKLPTGKRDWRRPPKAYDPTKRCPYCNIDGHDARAHRGQAPNPRAFTTEELRQQNYLPPTAPAQ